MPEIDKRLIQIQQAILNNQVKSPEAEAFLLLRTREEQQFFAMLNDGKYEPMKIAQIVRTIFTSESKLTKAQQLALIMDQLEAPSQTSEQQVKPNKVISIKQNDWKNLSDNDLRFVKSQCASSEEVYDALKKQNLIFDMQEYLQAVS